MQLIYYPDPILQLVCNKAPDQQRQDKASLAAKMWKIMDDNSGVGSAAPQVGLKIRMFVWKQRGCNQAVWNPSLTCVSGNVKSVEGCLSLPKINVTIQRATSSILTGTGLNGKLFRFIGGVITTRIWQHEVDHLNGKLIIDNMNYEDSKINRNILKELLNNNETEQNKV